MLTVATAGALTVGGASVASAAVTSVSSPTIANSSTSAALTVASSTPSTLLVGAVTQLEGPGSATTTFAGTGTTVTSVGGVCTPQLPPLPPLCLGGTSSVATSFDLDPSGLPAAPGDYTLDVCDLTCALGSATGDTTTVTVTGLPPRPRSTDDPTSIAAGSSGSVSMAGSGFAAGETLSIVRPGGSADDLDFTENTATSSATDLEGVATVGADVPAGTYDVMVTDTAGQTGVCGGCLSVPNPVGSGPTGPDPVTGLVVVPKTTTTASLNFGASSDATSYSVVVSTTSTTLSDPGVDVVLNGTKASVSGLAANTLYYVTVVASDANGASAPVVALLYTPQLTGLTFSASDATTTSGETLTLGGTLSLMVPGSPTGLPGQVIDIYSQRTASAGSAWSLVKSATTAQSGSYSVTVSPTRNTTYLARYEGFAGTTAAGDAPAVSLTQPAVVVAPIVRAVPKAKKSSRHLPLVVKGKVSPTEVGNAARLYVVSASGHLHRIATTVLTKTSHYRFRTTHLHHRGTFTLEVVVAAGTDNAKGTSSHFTVKRV